MSVYLILMMGLIVENSNLLARKSSLLRSLVKTLIWWDLKRNMFWIFRSFKLISLFCRRVANSVANSNILERSEKNSRLVIYWTSMFRMTLAAKMVKMKITTKLRARIKIWARIANRMKNQYRYRILGITRK